MKLYRDYGILNIKKDTCCNRCPIGAPLQRWSFPSEQLPLSERRPSWLQQGGHYFFRLCSLSLSRKASNAITKLPKAISKPIIPININMISAAVICATSPPMYSGRPVIKLGRLPPLSWVPYWNTITVRQEFQSDSPFVEYVEGISKAISKQSHGTKSKTGKH